METNQSQEARAPSGFNPATFLDDDRPLKLPVFESGRVKSRAGIRSGRFRISSAHLCYSLG
jgi:hypothetical protein